MSERTTTTTSVSLLPEASPSIASSDTRSLFVDSRGRIDMTDLLTSTREFSKQLPAAIDYAAPVDQANYDLPGYDLPTPSLAPRAEMFDDEYEEEPQTTENAKRGLGRAALKPFKWLDRNIAYGTAWAISKLPTTKTMEEREEYQKTLNEKFKDQDGDSWIRRRINAFGRNRMNILDRLPVYGVGAYAVGRLGGPLAIDFADDMYHRAGDALDSVGSTMSRAISGPREVTSGEGNGVDMAASTINLTPVQHELKPRVYVMGGHTQGDPNQGFKQMLMDAGVVNEGDNIHDVHWQAEMGMPGESINMIEADELGGDQIVDIVRDSGGEKIQIVLFSQSTQAGFNGLNEAHAQGVDLSNVEVIAIGGPSGSDGLGANPNIGISRPFLTAGGLEIDQPLPPGVKLTVRTDIADVFGHGGRQSLLTLAAMAVGPGHLPVGPENSILISRRVENGVTYEVWGPKDGINNPVTRMLKAQGMHITPEAEALANAAVPITMFGQETQYPDGPDVVSKAGAAADSYIPGSNGAFQAAANSALANPQFNSLTREFDDLVPMVDSLGRINPNDPVGAFNTIANAGKEVNEAVQSLGNLLQNPAKAANIAVDAANAAIRQTGGPALIPRFDETPQPAYRAPAPNYNQYVAPAAAAPVYETPAPYVVPAPASAPAPAPAPTPAPAPAAQVYVAPPAPVEAPAPAPYVAPVQTPAPAPSYAPVNPLFSSAPAAPQYAPVNPLFGNKPAEPQYKPVGPLFS